MSPAWPRDLPPLPDPWPVIDAFVLAAELAAESANVRERLLADIGAEVMR